ncbi:HEPN/Toprim-associated domain-containing protein [Cronobacter sakazakii]
MGTEISLTIKEAILDWSKNSLGYDHGKLFQPSDKYVRPPTLQELEYHGDDEDYLHSDDGILYRSSFRRKLKDVISRLDLLGFTLENAETEYNFLSNKIHEESEFRSEKLKELYGEMPTSMNFSEFVNFVKSYNLCDLEHEYDLEESREERKEKLEKIFDECVIHRIPRYGIGFPDSYTVRTCFIDLINNFHPYTTLRILAENPVNLNEYVEWDYGPLVSNGWANIQDVKAGADRLEKYLVATEGSSDAHVLERAFSLLKPDVKDFFKFIDMKTGHPFPGTGNLLKFADGLVKIDVQNLIIFLLDNDCEGIEAYNKIRKLSLPSNMACMHLPDHEDFNSFLAFGPHGLTRENINGRAVAIECFLDLNYSEYDEATIRWTNYKKEADAYQGSLENKDYYTRKFMDLKEDSSNFDKYNFSKMIRVLEAVIENCSAISSAIRLRQLEELYPDLND